MRRLWGESTQGIVKDGKRRGVLGQTSEGCSGFEGNRSEEIDGE